MISNAVLEINDKWLDFKRSHEVSPCCLSDHQYEADYDEGPFSCDHIVAILYERVFIEVSRHPGLTGGNLGEKCASMVQTVRQSLRQMPLAVEVKTISRAEALEVVWVDSEGSKLRQVHGLSSRCRVTLHRESTCSGKREHLLASGMCIR